MVCEVDQVLDWFAADGFRIEKGAQQIMLFSRENKKVGGWNTRDGHWYVSKLVAQGREDLLRDHGFEWMEKSGHQWWQRNRAANACAFANVVTALTGTP